MCEAVSEYYATKTTPFIQLKLKKKKKKKETGKLSTAGCSCFIHDDLVFSLVVNITLCSGLEVRYYRYLGMFVLFGLCAYVVPGLKIDDCLVDVLQDVCVISCR